MLLFGLPILLLTTYAATLIVPELRTVVAQYDSLDAVVGGTLSQYDGQLGNVQRLTQALTDAQGASELFERMVDVSTVLSQVSQGFLQLLILLVLTYTMLVDGPRFRAWVIDTVDRDGVIETYADVTDHELSRTLFGNIVNVFATGTIAFAVFSLYNLYAPATIDIPFPGLLGALAGLGSLIPMIGIKLVYLPVVGWLAMNAWTTNTPELIWPVLVLLGVSAVLVDFIPDTFIRAYASGQLTHNMVLVVAYIMGPTVFGPYGLFLAPILLVLIITASHILVPYVLRGTPPAELEPSPAELTRENSLYAAASAASLGVKRRIRRRYRTVVQLCTRVFK